MRYFDISFTVPATMLTTVVQLMSNEVSNLKIESADTKKSNSERVTTVERVRRGGRPSKTQPLIMAALADGKEHTYTELATLLSENGWAASTMSPLKAQMIEQGLIREVRKGVFVSAKAAP